MRPCQRSACIWIIFLCKAEGPIQQEAAATIIRRAKVVQHIEVELSLFLSATKAVFMGTDPNGLDIVASKIGQWHGTTAATFGMELGVSPPDLRQWLRTSVLICLGMFAQATTQWLDGGRIAWKSL